MSSLELIKKLKDEINKNRDTPENLKITNEELMLLGILYEKFKMILELDFTEYVNKFFRYNKIFNYDVNVINFSLQESFITSYNYVSITMKCEVDHCNPAKENKSFNISLNHNYFQSRNKYIDLTNNSNIQNIQANHDSVNIIFNLDEVI